MPEHNAHGVLIKLSPRRAHPGSSQHLGASVRRSPNRTSRAIPSSIDLRLETAARSISGAHHPTEL